MDHNQFLPFATLYPKDLLCQLDSIAPPERYLLNKNDFDTYIKQSLKSVYLFHCASCFMIFNNSVAFGTIKVS